MAVDTAEPRLRESGCGIQCCQHSARGRSDDNESGVQVERESANSDGTSHSTKRRRAPLRTRAHEPAHRQQLEMKRVQQREPRAEELPQEFQGSGVGEETERGKKNAGSPLPSSDIESSARRLPFAPLEEIGDGAGAGAGGSGREANQLVITDSEEAPSPPLRGAAPGSLSAATSVSDADADWDEDGGGGEVCARTMVCNVDVRVEIRAASSRRGRMAVTSANRDVLNHEIGSITSTLLSPSLLEFEPPRERGDAQSEEEELCGAQGGGGAVCAGTGDGKACETRPGGVVKRPGEYRVVQHSNGNAKAKKGR
ncbi:hypothetical protein C8R45DRAFT_1081852 [Mycena sanguinolenta]|nr:hypothetical protein C8R45DRAFT_1081852 [Mycena sanguinolenta]